MNPEYRSGIFQAEYRLLDAAEKVLQNLGEADNLISSPFEELYCGYKKILHQSVRLIEISDRHQSRLLKLQKELTNKNKAMEKEQALASKVQANILPFNLQSDCFQTGIYYSPSNQIGGDFFDAIETSDAVHFLIGDISGHSTSSALIMAVCNGMFRTLAHTIKTPNEIVSTANQMLSQMLTDSGMFLTLVYMTLDRENDLLNIISAGHNPVYLLNGKEVVTIDSTGPVLGWDPDDVWETVTIPFCSGDTLFLYTDGLVEAKNSSKEEFEPRLIEFLTREELHPSELVKSLLNEVTEFCGGCFEDDLTMFAIKRC